ncbi:hypothetical protein BN1051_03055 [Arthrobacter saudimassiliensis]|uniref:Uncharacterized protein n=1 Tax=Arthrobacter saudimassiliensis TaxID=1461584 RepID=A0A078MR66_9MICC|nr:hypothetical protein BN1051_03055 [Arthrobacter saudimassiliensis]
MDVATLATVTRINDQLDSLGPERDRADLEALYKIFSALAPSFERGRGAKRGTPEADGAGRVNHLLRLTIVDLWQDPRMPGRGVKPRQMHKHNKPFVYPWSPRARDLYFAAKADASVSTSGMLVLEHTIPLSILRDELMHAILKGCSQDEWTELFLAAHRGLSFAVLARDEDDIINSNGHRSALVADDPSPWARYRKAGMVQEDFIALTADPRWSEPDANRG